jgi:hypothetical protein
LLPFDFGSILFCVLSGRVFGGERIETTSRTVILRLRGFEIDQCYNLISDIRLSRRPVVRWKSNLDTLELLVVSDS